MAFEIFYFYLFVVFVYSSLKQYIPTTASSPITPPILLTSSLPQIHFAQLPTDWQKKIDEMIPNDVQLYLQTSAYSSCHQRGI